MPPHAPYDPAQRAVLDLVRGFREEVRRDLARVDGQLGRVNGDQRLLSIRAAARELGVRRFKDGPIYTAIRRGELRVNQIGKRLKIRKTDLVRWVEAQAEVGGSRYRGPNG